MRGKRMISIYLHPKSYDALQKIVEREAFNSVTNCAEYVLERYIEQMFFPDPMMSSLKGDMILMQKFFEEKKPKRKKN